MDYSEPEGEGEEVVLTVEDRAQAGVREVAWNVTVTIYTFEVTDGNRLA